MQPNFLRVRRKPVEQTDCAQPVRLPYVAMTEREVALAMIALTLSMFVAMLSNLVVLTALPRIVSDLHGTQAAYTWIVTSSMLTIAVCTPIWGRMSDLLNKKLLIQLCVAGYVLSSLCAGMAPAAWVIIVCRVAIGLCASGIIIMIQSISVEIMPARTRAKWIGYRSIAMSAGTVSAPSLGGFVTDHFGWRACFMVGVPFAILSIAMVQRVLRLPLPERGRSAKVDLPGAVFLATGIVALMLWVSMVGPRLGWGSSAAYMTLAAGAVLIGFALFAELRSSSPILPLELFRHREVMLCVVAGIGTGQAFFGSAVFLAPYLQIGRGLSPSLAGLMALPEAAGAVTGAMVASRIIGKHGRYKRPLIVGAMLILAGFYLLSTIGTQTPFLYVGAYVASVGAGLGIVSENLSLVVQNAVGRRIAGSAGALVVFFRMLGGVFSVAILGTLLSMHVASEVRSLGISGYDAHTLPKIADLTGAMRTIMEAAYAHGAASVYFACIPAALLILICVLFLVEDPLSTEIPSK